MTIVLQNSSLQITQKDFCPKVNAFCFFMKICAGAGNSLFVFQNPSLKIYSQIRHLGKFEAANFKYSNSLSKLIPNAATFCAKFGAKFMVLYFCLKFCISTNMTNMAISFSICSPKYLNKAFLVLNFKFFYAT